MAIAVTSAVSATTGTALLRSTSRPAASSRNSISLWATSTSLNRAFGLKTSHRRVTCSQSKPFKVKFTKKGNWRSKPQEVEVEVGLDDYLLTVARENGLITKKFPLCDTDFERSKCKNCRGKIEGEGKAKKLKGPPLAENIILTCRAFARSDMEIDITGT